MLRFTQLLLLAAITLNAAWAIADDEPPAPTASSRVLLAYRLSKTAESRDNFRDMIAILSRVEETNLDDGMKAYRRDLLAWSHNRHGEALADQAADLADAGKEEPADQTQQLALADFDASVKLNPKSYKATHNRGVSHAMLGHFDEALQDFSATIFLKKDFAKAWFNRAEVRYALGKFKEAITDYDQVLRIRPTDIGAYTSRGHAHFQLQDFEKALADYRQTVQLTPQNAKARANQGDAHLALGRYRQAVADYQRAVQLDDEFGSAHQRLAWLYATCPDDRYANPAEALRLAKLAIKLDGESDPRYLDTLAAAQASDGDYKAAAATADKALQLANTQKADSAKKIQARQALYRQAKAYTLTTPLNTGERK